MQNNNILTQGVIFISFVLFTIVFIYMGDGIASQMDESDSYLLFVNIIFSIIAFICSALSLWSFYYLFVYAINTLNDNANKKIRL